MEAIAIAARVLLRAGVPPELVTAGYQAKQRQLVATAAKEAQWQPLDHKEKLWKAAAGSGDADAADHLMTAEEVEGVIDHLDMMEGFGELLSPELYLHLFQLPCMPGLNGVRKSGAKNWPPA